MKDKTRYTINISMGTGYPPIRGVRLYGKKHASRVCEKHRGWSMVEVK